MPQTSRRQFLATSSALAAFAATAQADDAGVVNKAPIIGGLIDCQSHLFCPALLTMME
jgi:hypothetical protein